MNQYKYVFAQIVEILNNDKFIRLADNYADNRYIEHFTCWIQLFAMMFGQLCNGENLHDLTVVLEAHQGKCYRLGLGRKHIAKRTIVSANQNRDYRIFEEFALYMMKEACEIRAIHIMDTPGKNMRSTLLLQHYAQLHFPGLSFARRKEGLKLIFSMT